MQTNTSTRNKGVDKASTAKLTTETVDYYSMISDQLDAALAICDAASVLCALERAPEHHDTHPSHNITTGAGRAHGFRLSNETLPKLLKHARGLIQMADNDADCLRETVLDYLKGVEA